MIRAKRITAAQIKLFQRTIWDYYRKHARSLPWRKTRKPYHILVSEIMLQQTQVERVIEKYQRFISSFPDFSSLSQASLHDILSVWQGLGYNRRAIALKQIAHEVITKHDGILPSSANILIQLPGIGKATASAIAAFAFNQPGVFIETNIRRVFIHFFFQDRDNVKDSELLPLIEKVLDQDNSRQWYYALMDYGVMLKKEVSNPNRKSFHYQRQAPFQGSQRQLRGLVLKAVLQAPKITESALIRKLKKEPKKITETLKQLQMEGFIRKERNTYSIA
jgi:A/G-specific adenine glycosylase